MLARSLTYVAAYDTVGGGEQLVGFVNVAWDGGIHAFLLDTTVHPGGAAAWGSVLNSSGGPLRRPSGSAVGGCMWISTRI